MTEQQVREALSTVVDPELGINVVDLGLVHEVSIRDASVRVLMMTTSPLCPLGDFLKDEAESAIRARAPEVEHVDVTLVQDPPWDPSLMSDEARKQLGGDAAS